MMWGNAGRFRRGKGTHSSSSSDCYDSSSSDESAVQTKSCGASADHSVTWSNDDADHHVVDNLSITRRSKTFGTRPETQTARTAESAFNWDAARNITVMQEFWQEHARAAAKLYPMSVWKVIDAVKSESKVTQDKVLKAVASILSPRDRKLFPVTRAQMDVKVAKLGSFRSRITRTANIDLSHINLPQTVKPIIFHFIDPIIAWSICAHKLSRAQKLHFHYTTLRHPVTGELLYGASVQNGLIMQKACAKIPSSARVRSGPALLGLSWDAANASRRRSYTPILISVGNSDHGGLEMCICIGFMPLLPLSPQALTSDEGKQAVHELKQACASEILDVIERCSKTGFKCSLHTGTQLRCYEDKY